MGHRLCVSIELPPTELFHFAFPNASEMREGNWWVTWERGMALGPISRLDLHHQRSLNAIFSDRRPKLIFVLPTKGSAHWVGALPSWMFRLHEQFSMIFKFVLAEPTAADFMKQFGLKSADAPTLVIHDTRSGDGKFRLDGQMRKAAVWAFLLAVV